MNRQQALDRLQHEPCWDILILGGGATGLSAALDAATRGHRVALVERGDFAQGTSSRSTKLLHGGVRYLRQGHLSLVRDALRERSHLLRTAPHLSRIQTFVIPAYRQRDRAYYGVGLKIYDRLAGRWRIGRSQFLSRRQTLAHLPTIDPAGLVGGVRYEDGQFDDARMAIHLATTASGHGGCLVNHCNCVGLIHEQGRIAGATIQDQETGRAFDVRARCVINATGVFVDAIRQMVKPGISPWVRVSQGIHIVLPAKFLPGTSAMMIPRTADGRVLFAVPWLGRVIVGTTDTPCDSPQAQPRPLAGEYAFLMEHLARYWPNPPGDGDVLSVFAGQRPLIAARPGQSTASLSRDHGLEVSEQGLVSITGGKWTTCRQMAQDVIDTAQRTAGLPLAACSTMELSAHSAASRLATDGRADPLARYGEDRHALRALMMSLPSGGQLIHEDLPVLEAEVVWHVRHEMARTVEDVLARRTRSLILDARAAIAAAPRVARIIARELGRDEAWQRGQVASFTALASDHLPACVDHATLRSAS